MSVRTQTPAARNASTTKEIISVNATKATRWTLPLRPARPWVSHSSHARTHMLAPICPGQDTHCHRWMFSPKYSRGHTFTWITRRDQLLYTHQLPCQSCSRSYQVTSCTILTLCDSVKREACFVCRPCTSICAKINICHLFLQSSLMKSLQPAASDLPGVSREICCVGRGPAHTL